jgi:hypothetical protein
MTEISQPSDRKLRTPEAARALSDRGYSTAPATLAKLRCVGGGPPFVLFGRVPLYELSDLLEWAAERAGRKRTSTSDEAEHEAA